MQEQYKKLVRLAVIVGIVYLGFRFLLPLFFPFVLAYVIAVVLRKPVRFLWCRLRIKPAIGGAVLLVIFLLVAGGGIAYAVKLLLQQFASFVGNYDMYVTEWDGYLEQACFYFDSVFRLEKGRTFTVLNDGLDGIVLFFQEELIPFLTRNSVKAAVSVTELVAAIIIIFVAVLLFLADMMGKGAEEKREQGLLSFMEKEWHQVKHELSGAGIAYVKTQAILILLVSAVCTVGLLIIRNSYAMLFGVAIGIFDAFPVLGSGLVLVPWSIVSFIRGKAFAGAVLLTLFGICQFMREYLEPKLLGGKMGIRPVQSLMAVYIGYELFGVLGLFLGPFGLVLIKSMWRVTGNGRNLPQEKGKNPGGNQ
ncbi:MAG: sporulation integral membrane protein YtvI [Lachnospiraceae bacterium]|nr:sporulation integral membrane protein YtvI [Lachnospiraceae bacterium]MBQ8634333.1 sporulation integral membrane protein YtvI [Lachnospiraceae bacterium]